ncbi:MAG: hypothetical protein NT084_07250 [Bacteroidetes bacterium]|nr:hypothetical protein [Bacteroidota bacterium]
MKTTAKTIRFLVPTAILAFMLVLLFPQCKKDTQIVVVTVHDTISGKTISGHCTYPDFTNNFVTAKGALISLYLGTSVSGNPVATAIADSLGNYQLPYLLPNTYYVYAKYNTANQNFRIIDGIDFHTDPTDLGYVVALANSNVTKNVVLATQAPTGTRILTIIKADTIGSMGTKAYVPFEIHSKIEWSAEYSGAGNGGINGTTLAGGFSTFGNNFPNYGWGLLNFYFDEAHPINDTIRGYVLLSHINTFEAQRDTLYGGCVPKTLQVDTSGRTRATCRAVPITDTAWYYVNCWDNTGHVEKYGNGYVAHGTLKAFYKSAADEIEAPRVTVCAIDSANAWNGVGPGYQGPYSRKISKQIDMYFEFQGVNTAWNLAHTSYNKYAVFEGQFDFNRSDYYVKTTSIGNTVHVTPHVQLKGAANQNF